MKIYLIIFLILLLPVQGFCNGINIDKNKKIILLGEIHGTNEFPQFVYDYVKPLSNNKKSVHLLLEIPSDNQAKISHYLQQNSSSYDTTNNIKNLTDSYFWQRKIQDGRSSKAMFNLIKNIKMFNKHAIHPISINTFASASATGVKSTLSIDERYHQQVIETLENTNNDIYVIYTGRIHARKNFEIKPNQMSLASLLQHDYKISSYELIADKGSFWACYLTPENKMDCGSKELNTSNEKYHTYNKLLTDHIYSKYHDGYYHIETVTASRPFVD